MQGKFIKICAAIGIVFAFWAISSLIDMALDSSSETYHEMAEEIDQRDIDTGNAMNYAGDETSGYAVYEATQAIEHPPGKTEKTAP